MTARTPTICCPECAAPGDQRPGFKIENLVCEAVFVGDDLAVLDPIKLTCRTCQHEWIVSGAHVTVAPGGPL